MKQKVILPGLRPINGRSKVTELFSAGTTQKIIYMLLMIIISLPIRAQAGAGPAALLHKANEYYLKGDYQSAQSYYRKVLDSGIENGKIYYNLGNASFRMGNKGEAIYNYLLARQFIPRSEDLTANLASARHEVEDRIEPASSSSSLIRAVFFWYDWLSVKEMLQIFLVCNFLCWSGLIVRLFSPQQATNWLILLSLGLGITMGGTATFRSISQYLQKTAVVIVPQVAVQSGMDPASATLFLLHDGVEVSVERISGHWFLIRLASGKKGWVKNEHLRLVKL